MRRTLAAGALGLLALLPAACSDQDGPPSYDLGPRPVRESETPLPYRQTRLGEMRYTVLAIRTGLKEVVGSHGSWTPKGQYVRVRLLIENHGRDRHEFVPSAQMLVTADGRAHKPNHDAMSISRAVSGTQIVAREERRELDLWFDIPKTAPVRALRVNGDVSSSALGDQLKGVPAGTPDTVDIPLKP
ncbi:protein of unknown function [Thermomonospora echinospora]|uniref:DUF4352 domain-containing protein n=1 Tax=Thermomonospora echinospora TaxID=1992 RepID=A0A1H5STY8_9ACTN|nr:DUF4352 domain-containing protein [Thermomonospora echinospora]SEF53950.1 protein of unknown function [Thermomonospora echinospora]